MAKTKLETAKFHGTKTLYPVSGWCLQDSAKNLILETFDVNRDEAWLKSFGFLSYVVDTNSYYPNENLGEAFCKRYWKKEKASIRAAAKLGFTLVEVKVRKVEQ